MTYKITVMEKPIIRCIGDIERYRQSPNYDPARLHEQLIKLVTKPTLHSPERRLAMYHEALENHPREL